MKKKYLEVGCMKKVISSILLLLSVFSCLICFVSCDPIPVMLDYDKLITNTVKIELVDYENENPKLIFNLDGKKKPTFDFNKSTLIATLDDSKMEDFINDLVNYQYLYFGRTWNEPVGETLILYQNNGDMLVLYGCIYESEKGGTSYPGSCIMFDKDGEYIEYIGDFGYAGMDRIKSKYFTNTH